MSLPYPGPTASYTNFSSIDNYSAFPLDGGANTIQDFSEGSPQPLHYLDHEYHSLFDSGELSTSAPMPPPQHATGMTHPDNLARPFSDLYPEEIPPYQHLWFPPSTQAQIQEHPSPSRVSHKSSEFQASQRASSSSSSTRLLPTSSEMAITLISSPGAEIERLPPPPPVVVVNESYSVDVPSSGVEADCTLARERRHACSMCHKRFDRPSTLRKHLLVHTGEKAFQCEACGRRFGVASNLNRHVRRCVLKPVNTTGSTSHGGTDTTDTTSSTDSSERGRSTTSPVQEHFDRTTTTNVTTTTTIGTSKSSTAQKRRRRAPSPSRWIPASLLNFNLEAPQKTASLPLPPVRPSEWDDEERDSFDENIGVAPYHPREWQYKPYLPGPGLVTGFGRRSVYGAAGRGQTFGSLLVF